MEPKINVTTYFFKQVTTYQNQMLQIDPISTIAVPQLPASCNIVVVLIIDGLTDKPDTTIQITLKQKDTGEQLFQTDPFQMQHMSQYNKIVQVDLENFELKQGVDGEYEAEVAITQDAHTETYIGPNTLHIVKTSSNSK